jgi:N-acetylneuraminate synthase
MTDIAGRTIGLDQRPYIIAELSGNHGGSLDMALAIVEAIAASGADAVKLQTYTADTMTIDHDGPGFVIREADNLWSGNSLYALYDQAHTPWEWHPVIFERARELGLAAFSTPFDATAVDFLEDLDVPAYKVASFENTDLPLIERVAATGKPVIISTGMASLAEIDQAVTAVRDAGCRDLILLKCTSTYPAPASASNLSSIPVLRSAFGVEVGLSDHTLGIGVPIAAVALGATVIEKHVTLRRADGAVDSAFSLEPEELTALVNETRQAQQAVGHPAFGPTADEVPSLTYRRSLYFVRDVAAGQVLTEDDVRAIRPGFGLPPRHLSNVLGRRASGDVARGTPVSWDLVT